MNTFYQLTTAKIPHLQLRLYSYDYKETIKRQTIE